MARKAIVCSAALAAVMCLATETFAAVGDPTGTTYGISGKNLGHADENGNGVGTFGYDLLNAPDYAALPPNLTMDDQLGPGPGVPHSLTFDGVAETFGNLEFNESHQIYDNDVGSKLHLYSDFYGIDKATADASPPLSLGWDTPGHLVEFSIKDTDGSVLDGGGTVDNVFASTVTRYDDLIVDGTTGGPNQAVPVFPADRPPEEPGLEDFGLDGKWVGSYFYFKSGGMPYNPVGANFTEAILGATHPNDPSQEIFLLIFDYGYFDFYTTHDIGPGTFSAGWDLGGLVADLNHLSATLGLDFADPWGDIDEVVFGYIYRMIADSDGNEDGVVDGLDYLRWASAFGPGPVVNPAAPDTIAPAPGRTFNQSLGDYNSDGIVDGVDYLRWANEFGFVGDGSDLIATAVPEPSSLMGLVAGLVTLCGLARRRNRG